MRLGGCFVLRSVPAGPARRTPMRDVRDFRPCVPSCGLVCILDRALSLAARVVRVNTADCSLQYELNRVGVDSLNSRVQSLECKV